MLNRIVQKCLAGLRGQPNPTAPASGKIVLYTRAHCPLCDEAKAILRKHLPNGFVEEVDIDADDDLRMRYTNCVPVVEIDGTVRFRGHVNEVLLKRLLRHR